MRPILDDFFLQGLYFIPCFSNFYILVQFSSTLRSSRFSLRAMNHRWFNRAIFLIFSTWGLAYGALDRLDLKKSVLNKEFADVDVIHVEDLVNNGPEIVLQDDIFSVKGQDVKKAQREEDKEIDELLLLENGQNDTDFEQFLPQSEPAPRLHPSVQSQANTQETAELSPIKVKKAGAKKAKAVKSYNSTQSSGLSELQPVDLDQAVGGSGPLFQ